MEGEQYPEARLGPMRGAHKHLKELMNYIKVVPEHRGGYSSTRMSRKARMNMNAVNAYYGSTSVKTNSRTAVIRGRQAVI